MKVIYNSISIKDLDSKKFKPSELYHVSDNPHLSLLNPRIPETASSHYENTVIPRVCFATSIQGCLTSIYQENSRKLIYVYQPDTHRYTTQLRCTLPYEAVCDANLTGEVWYLKPIYVMPIGILTNIQPTGMTPLEKETSYTDVYYKHTYDIHYYHK